MKRFAFVTVLLIGAQVSSGQQYLPDGPGKAETVRVCGTCHDISRVAAIHQDRAGWQATIEKMMSLGASAPPEEFEAILGYLAKTFPAEELPKIHINTARPIDLEAAFTLRRSQSLALIAYRDKIGGFKSLDDLKNVPGIDFANFDSKKDRIEFN